MATYEEAIEDFIRAQDTYSHIDQHRTNASSHNSTVPIVTFLQRLTMEIERSSKSVVIWIRIIIPKTTLRPATSASRPLPFIWAKPVANLTPSHPNFPLLYKQHPQTPRTISPSYNPSHHITSHHPHPETQNPTLLSENTQTISSLHEHHMHTNEAPATRALLHARCTPDSKNTSIFISPSQPPSKQHNAT